MNDLAQRLTHLPPLAYGALIVSLLGVAAELTFHFVPLSTVPAWAMWFNNLGSADKEFFTTGYELVAHFFIGLGLTGMLTAFAQMYLKDA